MGFCGGGYGGGDSISGLVVVVVIVEVVVVGISDDKAGSWGWSIIHFFVFIKNRLADGPTNQWTNKPSCRDLIKSVVDV